MKQAKKEAVAATAEAEESDTTECGMDEEED